MKLKTVKIVFALLFCATFYNSNTFAQTISEQLDIFFTSPQYSVNGNVLVAENGKVIYRKSFGLADAKNKLPNTENSRFEIASITKTFTSTAILQLKDKGKLNLDKPFVKYFPDFPYPEITIRHLLSHTSGLPDLQIFEELVKKNPNKIFTIADIIPAFKSWKQPLAFKAGENWSYSNSGYCLLALLVEKLSGLKFEDYVRQHIFEPAKMSDSYFETDELKNTDTNKAKNQRYPQLYAKELQAVQIPKWNSFTGNGGIVSTTNDLLKFDQTLYSGKLLKQATLDEAFMPMKLTNGKNAKTDSIDDALYGLGWFIFEDESAGKIVWHGGGRPGVVTVFLRNITKKQTVVVFDNSFNRATYRLGANAMNILNSKPIVTRKKSLVHDYGITLVENGTDEAFSKLVGLKSNTATYYLDEGEMNDLAYQLLYEATFAKHDELALEVAKLNAVFFPDSFNVYDTYGEILAKTGKKDAAILMYKKSIALNPKNEAGKKALEELKK